MSSPGLIDAIRLWMERYATEDFDPRWSDYPPPTGRPWVRPNIPSDLDESGGM